MSVLQSTKMLLDKSGEHVCSVTQIPRVRLDEERFEGGSNRGQTLVIPDKEATCKGCRQHVEGASKMHLVAEGCAMVGRRHEPVVGRQGCRISCGEGAEVVEGDADCSCRIDANRWRESWSVRRRVRVDLNWSAPG